MNGDTLTSVLKENLNHPFTLAHLNLPTDMRKGNGIMVPLDRDMAISRHLANRPFTPIPRIYGQCRQCGALTRLEQCAATLTIRHFPLIELLQLLPDRLVHCFQREKGHVAQSEQNPGLHRADCRFSRSLVRRTTRTCRQGCQPIILDSAVGAKQDLSRLLMLIR